MAGIATGAVSGAEAGSFLGPWGTVGGAVVGGVLGALSGGGKQSAPATIPYVAPDLQQTQAQAIAGDQGNATSLDQLLAQSNQFQQGQATSLMNQALPGYSGFASNLTNTASSLAADPYAVPKSVTDQLSQYAAENNISEGTGASSGFSGSNTLRSLGVNALQYGQANMSSAMNALQVLSGTAPRTSPMSPMSFEVTPAQQAGNLTNTNTLNQSIAQGGANANTAAANYNSSNLYDQTVSALGSSQYLASMIHPAGSPNGAPQAMPDMSGQPAGADL